MAEDYGIILEIDVNGDLTLQPLKYWPGKLSKNLICPNAWDKQSRKLKIGSQGLQLTVLKPGGKNKNISLEKMQVIRNSLFPDLTKVTLGALFDDEISNQKCLHTSDVIFDKPRYWIDIKGLPVRSICTHNDHIIYIDHNSDIKVTRVTEVGLKQSLMNSNICKTKRTANVFLLSHTVNLNY